MQARNSCCYIKPRMTLSPSLLAKCGVPVYKGHAGELPHQRLQWIGDGTAQLAKAPRIEAWLNEFQAKQAKLSFGLRLQGTPNP